MFAHVSRSSREARRAAHTLNRHSARVANEEVQILISTVEDLIARLEGAADPELTQLRKQTEAALASAKDVISQREARLRDRASELAEQGGAYVREHPWTSTSLGLAALCVVAIAFWTAGRTATIDRL